MNKIVNRTGNVNFTSVKTCGEAANMITRFDDLVNLSKFALCSEPERFDAIQKIKYALINYKSTDAQRNVLEKVIDILMINPANFTTEIETKRYTFAMDVGYPVYETKEFATDQEALEYGRDRLHSTNATSVAVYEVHKLIGEFDCADE